MQLKHPVLLTTLALLSPATFAATPCASLTGLKIPGYDVSIKQATVVPAGPLTFRRSQPTMFWTRSKT